MYCEFGVCLAGNLLLKFARAPHSTIQRSAPRFILRTRLPTQNSPPLPRGTDSRHAGLHTASSQGHGREAPARIRPRRRGPPQHHTVSAPRGSLGNGGVVKGADLLSKRGARSGEVSLGRSTRRSPRSGATAAGWTEHVHRLAHRPPSDAFNVPGHARYGRATHIPNLLLQSSMPSRVHSPFSHNVRSVTKWTIFVKNALDSTPLSPLVNTTLLIDR